MLGVMLQEFLLRVNPNRNMKAHEIMRDEADSVWVLHGVDVDAACFRLGCCRKRRAAHDARILKRKSRIGPKVLHDMHKMEPAGQVDEVRQLPP